jgi:hypothetical protein
MDNEIESITSLLQEWKDTKEELEVLFREREQKNAQELMTKGISLFKQFLTLSNRVPGSLDEPFKSIQLDFKPVNLEERLGFVMSRPALFHSYRQLSELMIEQEKLYVKKNIQKKASKPIG